MTDVRTGDWLFFPLSGHPQLLQVVLATPRRVWFKQFQRAKVEGVPLMVRAGSTTPRVFAELLKCPHDLIRGEGDE